MAEASFRIGIASESANDGWCEPTETSRASRYEAFEQRATSVRG